MTPTALLKAAGAPAWAVLPVKRQDVTEDGTKIIAVIGISFRPGVIIMILRCSTDASASGHDVQYESTGGKRR